MSVATPSISVLSNEMAGNGPISIYSTPIDNRKTLNGVEVDENATFKNNVDTNYSKPSPSYNNAPVGSSTVQLNSMTSASSTTNRPTTNNGVSNSSKRSSHIQGPMAILTPCSNSHPFDERRIPVTREEERAIKFGRAVARFQPAQNNAIFDCKVLSRNHAILWHENDQFYIKDTRSSNGTFVNNQRLSSSGEESAPRILHSGDILQLGVDIIDHAKNVACGCTICIVRLIDERGEECVGNDEISLSERLPLNFMERLPNNCSLITHEKLFKLSQYMKEAQYREQLFTERLRNLESVLITTQEAAESGWQALINEERLLSRIENLENQLSVYKSRAIQSGSSEEIQDQMQQLLEDRTKAEFAAKDSLKKAEDQIYEANMKVHDMERLLQSMDENNQSLERRNSELDEENKRQSSDYDKILQCYNEASKEISNLKESLAAAKKSASTFSVTRIEAPAKKSDSTENCSDLSSINCQNGASPERSPTKVSEKQSSPPSIFFQEAQVQTDPLLFQHAELSIEEDTKTTTEATVQQTSPNRDLTLESQFLLISMFPLAFILFFFTIFPFTWFLNRNSTVTATDNTESMKDSNLENLKKAK